MLCKSLITALPEYDLQEVTELSGVLEAPDDYIPLPYKDSLNENVKTLKTLKM